MLLLLVANQKLKERSQPPPGNEPGALFSTANATIPRLTLGTRDPHSLLSVLADDIVRIIMLSLVLDTYDRVATAAHFAHNSPSIHSAAFDYLGVEVIGKERSPAQPQATWGVIPAANPWSMYH